MLVRFRTRRGLPGYEVVAPPEVDDGIVLVNRDIGHAGRECRSRRRAERGRRPCRSGVPAGLPYATGGAGPPRPARP